MIQEIVKDFFGSLNKIKLICRFSIEENDNIRIYNVFSKKGIMYILKQGISFNTSINNAMNIELVSYNKEYLMSLEKQNCIWMNVPLTILEKNDEQIVTDYIVIKDYDVKYQNKIKPFLKSITNEQLNIEIEKTIEV